MLDIFSMVDYLKVEDDCLVITLENSWTYMFPLNPKVYNQLGFLKILLSTEFYNDDYDKTGLLIELSYSIYGSGLLGEVIYGSVITDIIPEYDEHGDIQYKVYIGSDLITVKVDGLSLSLKDIKKTYEQLQELRGY